MNYITNELNGIEIHSRLLAFNIKITNFNDT